MSTEQMLVALDTLPEPDLLMATKITDQLGAGRYYRADTVVMLLQNQWLPIDDALAQKLAELCNDEVQTPRFLRFLNALARLCQYHGVTLSTSGYDGLQVWDFDANSGPIHCAGIEDRTTS